MAAVLRVALVLGMVLGLGGCERRSVGGEPPGDGSAPLPDAVAPPPDGIAPAPDGQVLGCQPQDAQEDSTVFCDECAFCGDLLPWQWNGDECRFAPTCCGCVGADCGQRFRTFDACEQVYGGCPHALYEVAYPDARLIFWMPGGFAGHGPLVDLNGYGELQTWLTVRDLSDPGPPDYTEQVSQREANTLFSMLDAVDFTGLPHPPLDYSECYPQLWLWWDQGPAYDPMVLDYPRANRLEPELAGVYAWFDVLLCRGDGLTGYPETLPSEYCMWW